MQLYLIKEYVIVNMLEDSLVDAYVTDELPSNCICADDSKEFEKRMSIDGCVFTYENINLEQFND